jgi:catechol 2,3-dioxygenase-like lactoylglutathione lyase family enzyme
MNRIDHLGIAVRDLDAAERIYTDLLGAPPYKREEVALFLLELGWPCVKHAREKVRVHEALRY